MAGGGGIDGKSPRIDLVPIIDAMTCVIFFLLLSSTFIEYTKITMPPAVSAVAAATVSNDPPVAPKMLGVIKGSSIEIVLSWDGKKPDRIVKRVKRDPKNAPSEELRNTALAVAEEFNKKFPNEKTVLLGFSSNVTYQEMISTMDGARKVLQDLVMVSWTEAQSAEAQVKE